MSEVKIADPGPLGLAGFGITTCILSLINAKILDPKALGVVLGLALIYGGGAQLLAGIWEFRKGNTFGATAFSSYGAFWIAFYIIVKSGTSVGIGWFLLFFGILTFYLWIGTFYLNKALFWVFLTLWLAFFLLAFGTGSASFNVAGGYVGLICGLTALYASAAVVVNATAGHTVLPVGRPFRAPTVTASGLAK